MNELNIAGLPVPSSTDLDSTLNATDKDSPHNQAWNWMGAYSWCQETYLHDGAYRAYRGYYSARHWNFDSATSRYGYRWRPVLEILNSAPLISGTDGNLGAKSAPFSVVYQVSDPDGDQITITEKLDGAVLRTIADAAQGVDLEFVLDLGTWNTLALGPHTLTITAED